MAEGKSKSADTAPAKGEKVKMVKRHTEYQEVDVEASQAAADAPDYSGKNPHREGSAQWMSWENHKREAKGLPATNNL